MAHLWTWLSRRWVQAGDWCFRRADAALRRARRAAGR